MVTPAKHRTPRPVAKILEVGPYPPPLSGWSIRIRFVKHRLEGMGHVCKVLNVGKNRRVPGEEYIQVRNALDYLVKVLWYSARGYTIHMHTNGDVWAVGWAIAMIGVVAGCLFGHRAVLSFHAGTHQVYFPRQRSGRFFPILYLLFKLPKLVICDNAAVKEAIVDYGISADKVVPIQTFGSQYVDSPEAELPEHVEAFLSRYDAVIFTYFFLRSGYHLDTLVRGFALVRQHWPNIGLINAGSVDDCEASVRTETMNLLESTALTEHVCFANDLSHEQFLTLLRRSKLYLRTPTTDGECASVLEALVLNVPVVAAENNRRPTSVITYVADDPASLCERVCQTLTNYEASCDRIVVPELRDTVKDEVEALICVWKKQKEYIPDEVAGG